MANEELNQLRAQVADYDQRILELIAQRLETTKRIGEIKQKEGLPIRDFRVEVEVLRRAREKAALLGLDERVAEEISERLMAAAVQTQAELPPVIPSGPRKRVHVVGGHGRMGSWLTRFFESQGHQVSVTDPDPGPFSAQQVPLAEAVAVCDVIILATNLSSTPNLLQELLPLIPRERRPLIFDIASLKAKLVAPLRQACREGHRVTSLHPMFAPGAALLHGRAVLVCDAGNREATDEAKSLFADTALGLFEVPLEEHDKMMTVVLGLSHLTNLIFGRAVCKAGFPFPLLGRIASTTFAKQIKTAAEVAEENPALYHEIQYFNQDTESMLADLESSLQEFCAAARSADGQRFAHLMAETSAYLKADEPSPSVV
jgi:chorismate mutase/prephenate dehydrogenase